MHFSIRPHRYIWQKAVFASSPPWRIDRSRKTRCLKAVPSNDRKSSFSVEKAQKRAENATEKIAKLLQAEDPEAVAAAMVDDFTEEFFLLADTYVKMAQKDGEAQLEEKLLSMLKIAMQAKNKTLRAEIQLFNELVAEESASKRKELLERPGVREILFMNDGYFFQLVQKMIKDVEGRPHNKQNQKLIGLLKSVQQGCQEVMEI